MSDHVHELGQGFNVAHMEEYVWCITCKKKWSKLEITRRLNATERLSAEDAMPTFDKVWAKFTSHDEVDRYTVGAVIHHLRKVYRPYAAALEGEDAPE